MENRNGSMTSFEAIMQLLEGKASRLMFIDLITRLLKREEYVDNIFHEYRSDEWEIVLEAMEALNTERSLRIAQSIQYHLEHTN